MTRTELLKRKAELAKVIADLHERQDQLRIQVLDLQSEVERTRTELHDVLAQLRD